MASNTPAPAFPLIPRLSAGPRLMAAALAGILMGAAFTKPGLPVLGWVALAPLIVAAIGARPGVSFWCGFFNAIAFVLTCLFWIATVLKVHGGLSEAGGAGVLLLIAAAWGCVTGFFTWSVNRVSRGGATRACVAAPFLWVSVELLRDHLPDIAFPWNLLGYAGAKNLALAQMTTVTGIFGLSLLLAAFNSLLAWVFFSEKGRESRARIAALGLTTIALLAVAVLCPQLVPGAPAYHIARGVQLNLPEAEIYPADWFQANAPQMDEFERLSIPPARPPADLLIWPEAPAPFSMQDPRFARRAESLAVRFGHPFLAGVVDWKPAAGASATRLSPFNSAALLDARGQRVFSYDKIHLVPFGEFEPFPLIHRVVRSISEEVGGFRAGSSYTVGELPGGQRFGVFICYESIFPDGVRRFAARGANLLINISNDGWFGRSAAPEQHLQMARVRAIENRRWLLRVTNNGYTVSVDPYGRIATSLAPDIRNAAELPYDFRADITLYTRFGDWIAYVCVLASAVFLALTLRRGS